MAIPRKLCPGKSIRHQELSSNVHTFMYIYKQLANG